MAEEQTNTIGSLKTRLANLYLNQVSLSESLKIIQNACVNTATQTIDGASEEQLAKIKEELAEFEKNVQAQPQEQAQPENVEQATFSSGPETTCNESSGPVVPTPAVKQEQKGACGTGPHSGPESGI